MPGSNIDQFLEKISELNPGALYSAYMKKAVIGYF